MSDRYYRARSAYEDALMSGNRERRRVALVELDEAGEEMAQRQQRRLAAPDFETLLADPTIQPDPEGRILASIEEYRNAKPASAGLSICGTPAPVSPVPSSADTAPTRTEEGS